MKKTYISPATRTVKITVQHLMAGSPGLKSSGYNAGSEILSRKNWDDDEWDDFED